MSPRAARLQPILERLLEVERQAHQRLLAAETEQAAQQNRLRDLRRYADEYRRRTQTGVVSAATLREYQQFVARLEQLALLQERAVAAAEQACQQAREALQRQHRRSEGLRRLIDRYQAQALRKAERREQRALDDWVNARVRSG
ncbi:flagellar export protein FliJ [Immundisolibacter sp.]|uniref:flagellar export protein FliJ n=1 Tax=Immundisolibacter sp. TaxID=1934948 RepID=UPI002629C96A|nr:flagellar export protein FliJ [Immundisolibacter sp.]MDD3650278.1 flagellar export protein FliJ [Immundisolibacter sp.]